MKTQITKQELKSIHDIACANWKKKIIEYANKEPFSNTVNFIEKQIQEMVQACSNKEQTRIVKEVFDIQDITKQIDSLESAITYLGECDEEVQQLRLLQSLKGLSRNIIAEQELVCIIKALNEKEELDWNNHSQPKYYAWWYMGNNFRLLLVNNSYYCSYCSARLCLKSRELAEYVTEQFPNLYKEYIMK